MQVTSDKATYEYGKDGELEEVTIQPGEVVHYRGMPFRVKDPIVLLGRTENMKHTLPARRTDSKGRPWWYYQVLDFCRRAHDLHHKNRSHDGKR